jgi:galactokinase/mevalonate kinase-like predicted kinase
MGTSSILGACTVAALDYIAGRKFDVQRVMELTLALEQEMNTGGGWEDQMGALVPGIKILRTSAGKRQRPAWETVKDAGPFAALLKERALLYFTGEKRMARNVLRGFIANYKADGDEGKERVAALRDGAERCFKAVKAKNWERFAACVNEYWMLKKAMDPGSTNERIEYIIARISPWTSAVTIAGAGGGGFMFILAKSAEAKEKIVASLNRRPPVKWARFYDFDIDVKGLEFHV